MDLPRIDKAKNPNSVIFTRQEINQGNDDTLLNFEG